MCIRDRRRVHGQQQNTLIEKITDMIKDEMNSRLESDNDLKGHINAVSANILEDLNLLKDSIEKQNKIFAKDLKEIAADSAERDNQLSRYVDDELKKAVEFFTKKYDKLKQIFAKLAEQFRTHLIAMESMKKDFLQRFEDLDKGLESTKNELYNAIGESEARSERKLLDTKEGLETLVTTKCNVLDDKTNKLQKELNSFIEIMKEALENSRNVFLSKVDKLQEQNDGYHKNNFESLNKLMGDMGKLSKFLGALRNDFEENTRKQEEELAGAIAHFDANMITERLVLDQRMTDIYDEATQAIGKLRDTTKNLGANLDSLKQDVDTRDRENKRTFEEHRKEIDESKTQLTKVSDDLEDLTTRTQTDLGEIYSRATVGEALWRSGVAELAEQVKSVVEALEEVNTERLEGHDKMGVDLEALTEEMHKQKAELESKITETCDSKIKYMFERVKKENEELWQMSIKYSSAKLNELDLVDPKTGNLANRFTQVIGVEDNYGKPAARKRQDNDLSVPISFQFLLK
eukprot:TRINITY_DN9415_c0_g2_i1.p1 TRINITY_DN9415_c0_g2~~TRINITY_DN9415_c0_g2_i1.p1  ORF type:complete len:518 (+),score=148.64 TRINITY_DN9415_c0_g2_i1:65-1618(+)